MPSRCYSVNTCYKKIDMKKGPNLRWSLIQCSGGDEGDRTPDLLTASQALSQLSYAPVRRSTIRELGRRCKDNFGKTSGGGDAAAPAPRAGPIVLPGPPVLSGPARRPFELAREPSHPASGLPRAACPIIGTGREPSRPVAPKPGRFTTMIPGRPTTPPFLPISQAPYLRFCKQKMRRARGLPIHRSKLA